MDSMNKIMPVVSGIHDEKALADFMAKEQSSRLPLGYLQYRVTFIPDYSETESIFVYKIHHSLADGIANILFFNDMTDEPKLEGYPTILVRFSLLQDILIKLLLPFYLLWLTFKLLFVMKSEKNGFKNPAITSKLNSLKNIQLIPDININDVKRCAAELTGPGIKVTINDVLMTVLSKTIYDYLRLKTEDKETNFVNMACPFSLRPPPTALGDYTFDNNFAIVNLKLRLVSSLSNGLKQINRDMLDLKKSIEPIGLFYLIKLVMQLPGFIHWHIFEDYANKMTFGFSNVPGPKLPFVVAGRVNRGVGFIMPVGRSIVGSFSIISHVDVVKVIISMDKACMESTDFISDLFL